MNHRTYRPRRAARRRAVAIAALVGVAAIGAVMLLTSRGPDPAAALEGFLGSLERRDYAAAAALTDGDRAKVAAALEANVDGLDRATLYGRVEDLREHGGEARATVAYRWNVPGIGEFSYENPRIGLVREGDRWLVRWRAGVVHPKLGEDGGRLGTTREFRARAPILGRGGARLVRSRRVVEIGVIPAKVKDLDAAVAAIAGATDAGAKALHRSIDAAENPRNFVPAITMRKDEFREVEGELDGIAGIEFGFRELPLAPSREFARALLGSVGPVTAEQLKDLGAPYAAGDNVGRSGLQLAYEKRLAGTPERAVVIRNAAGVPIETLHRVAGEPGTPLRTTLDPNVQAAAEAALGDGGDVTALVAVEPASGDVLAAASRPVDDAFNRAFEGRYPPGSTFKVVSTAALLADGLDPDQTVDCPPTIIAGGRSFRNFEGGAAGAVPFRTDFAESCNTAFVSLADRLRPGDLKEAAARFGLGEGYELGVPAFTGSVPVSRDGTEQAAAMIGQGRILASPVSLAVVAATVAEGRWRQPRVLASDPRASGPPLPAGRVEVLRSLMRGVVTRGTGTALGSVAGEPIGKSGTAEYGAGDPPPTHAWFIAARDDIALAVLVEDRPAGGEYAAPIAARFLTALDEASAP